jgi:hypothetical protein
VADVGNKIIFGRHEQLLREVFFIFCLTVLLLTTKQTDLAEFDQLLFLDSVLRGTKFIPISIFSNNLFELLDREG